MFIVVVAIIEYFGCISNLSYCILTYVEFLFIGIVAIVKFIFIDSHIGCRNCRINIYLNFYVHTQVVIVLPRKS